MTNYKELGPKRFDVRNLDLALLCSEAAIDLRNYISKRREDKNAIQYLSKLIYEATEGEKRAMEPGNNLVLGYAISGRKNYNKHWKWKKDEDVVSQARLISEDLKNFEKLPKEKLEDLIKFCNRLGQESHLYFDSVYPDRPQGPYHI